jgi:hypothetical protein
MFGIDDALIGGGLSLLGGILGGNSAQNAAQTSANAQLEAGRQAAEAARFRPVGITTRFGSSNFQFDPQGYLTGAGYNVSPELKAYQDRLMSLTGQGLTQAEQAQAQYAPLTGAASGLFNLGQQYLAQSPEQVAADYMAKQQALLAPGRERESAALANQLYSKGRTGLSIAQGGGLMAANPEQAALANARAMQDLQLAAQANQAGQQQVQFGQGLFGAGAGLLGNYYSGQNAALAPFQSTLGLTGTIENLGQSPLDIGAQLGGRSATAGAQVGQSLLSSGINAARTAQQGNAYNPFASALQGFGSNPYLMNSMFNRTPTGWSTADLQNTAGANFLGAGVYG